MAKPVEPVTVVAELTITSSLGDEIVTSFDKAWHRMLDLPTPVHVRFNAFVRKD